MEESLRKVKTLGQADEEVDDLAKWITKSRTREEEDKELAREEALNAQRRQAEQVCLVTCWCLTLICLSPHAVLLHLPNRLYMLHAAVVPCIGQTWMEQLCIDCACCSSFLLS